MNFQCPSCGKEIPDSSVACAACGHSFMVTLQPGQQQPAPPGYGAPPQGYGAPPGYAPPQEQQQQQQGYPPHPYGGFPPPSMIGVECKEAQTALIVSIVGFFCCGVVLGPIAIFLGLKAKTTIAANPGMQGDQKATAAIAIGGLETAIYLFYVLRMMAGMGRGRRF